MKTSTKRKQNKSEVKNQKLKMKKKSKTSRAKPELNIEQEHEEVVMKAENQRATMNLTEAIDYQKLGQALQIIKNFEANLPDDTYLDQLVDGIDKVSSPKDCRIFFKESGLRAFCKDNINSTSGDLKKFVFRLLQVTCKHSYSLPVELLQYASAKWVFEEEEFLHLLEAILQYDKDFALEPNFIDALWIKGIIPAVMSFNNDKSHFWKGRLRSLIATAHFHNHRLEYKRGVRLGIKNHIARHAEVFAKSPEAMEGCRKRLYTLCRQHIDEMNDSIMGNLAEVGNETSLQGQLYRLMLQQDHDGIEEVLISNLERTPSREWIGCARNALEEAKFQPIPAVEKMSIDKDDDVFSHLDNDSDDEEKMEASKPEAIVDENGTPLAFENAIVDQCMEFARDDHSLLLALGQVQNVNLQRKLWRFVFDFVLRRFLDTTYTDKKLLNRSLCTAKALQKSGQVKSTRKDFNDLIKLAMMQEMTPLLRSDTINLATTIIPQSTYLSKLNDQLYILKIRTDWQTIDALLNLLAQAARTVGDVEDSDKSRIWLDLWLMGQNYFSTSKNSFVRTAGLRLLQATVLKTQKTLANLDDMNLELEAVLEHETEAIVRRQACDNAIKLSGRKEVMSWTFDRSMLVASIDEDWEVREKAVDYYLKRMHLAIKNAHKIRYIFKKFIDDNMILWRGLQVATEDYDPRIRNRAFIGLKHIRCKIRSLYNDKMPIENIGPHVFRRFRVSRKFLTNALKEWDFTAKQNEYEDYCETKFSVNSVLEDIIQAGDGQGLVDTVDCY